MLAELILFFVAAALLFFVLAPKRLSNFPPGPPSYPIVGSSFTLKKLGTVSHKIFFRLGEIYGPVTGLRFGRSQSIIINGYEASKEFYKEDNFIARPALVTVSALWGGRMLGVFFSSGRLWQEQRRFILRHLRDFGFGKTSMEGLIHEEAEECIKSMKKAIKEAGSSSVISVHDKFGVSVINILWAIIAGNRYSHEDQEFLKLLNIIRDSFRAGNIGGLLLGLINNNQYLRHLPYFKQEFDKLTRGPKGTIKMLDKSIEEHEKTWDPNGEPRDLIDVYLKAMAESKNDPDSTFFRDQLMQICSDLFQAGSESTSNSIAYAVLYMLLNPDCQAKVHKELDDVVGRDRLPSFNDKDKLPYTFAAITEAFRMSPVAPISVPHMNTEPVKFMGYDIPAGTFALVNYTSTNKDKNYWGDAETFRPERFLDENGQFSKAKLDHVMGFGAGKRQCLGEPLARLSNYLIFTAVMQRFKFELVPGQPKPTTEDINGFSVSPHPFSAKVTARY